MHFVGGFWTRTHWHVFSNRYVCIWNNLKINAVGLILLDPKRKVFWFFVFSVKMFLFTFTFCYNNNSKVIFRQILTERATKLNNLSQILLFKFEVCELVKNFKALMHLIGVKFLWRIHVYLVLKNKQKISIDFRIRILYMYHGPMKYSMNSIFTSIIRFLTWSDHWIFF